MDVDAERTIRDTWERKGAAWPKNIGEQYIVPVLGPMPKVQFLREYPDTAPVRHGVITFTREYGRRGGAPAVRVIGEWKGTSCVVLEASVEQVGA